MRTSSHRQAERRLSVRSGDLRWGRPLRAGCADSNRSQGRRRAAGVDRCTETEVVQKKKAIVCLLPAALYPAAAAVFRTGGRLGAMRSNSIPKGILATYERIVGLTDDVCDRR